MRGLIGLACAGVFVAACSSDGGAETEGDDVDQTGGAGDGGTPGTGGAEDGSGGGGGSVSSLDCTDEQIWCGGNCLDAGETIGACSRIYESENILLNAPLTGTEAKIFLGNPELIVMNLDGSGVMQLSDKRPVEMVALGDTLYFISYDNGSLDGSSLYSIPIAGGAETELTNDLSDPSQLSIIGDRLYFREQIPSSPGTYEIVSFDLTGGDKQVHTTPSVYTNYTASDSHLYYGTWVEMDGGSDVWTVARALLDGTASDVEDLADGEHDGFAWGNDKLYYLEGGFFEWDPGTGQETMLLDNSMMGPPPPTAYIVDGHYVGYDNQGGIIIDLATLEMSELETDGWFYSFIANGRLFYVDGTSVVAIDVP